MPLVPGGALSHPGRELQHARLQSHAVLPGHRLLKGGVAVDDTKSAGLLLPAEDVEPLDGEPGAAHGEVSLHRPVAGESHELLFHAASTPLKEASAVAAA